MAKGLGSNPGRNFGLPSMRKSIKPKAKGIYPDKESGAGEYGSTQFPTIVESYNRESDYKRWKMGQEYYFGTGKSWGDRQINVLARFLNGTASFSDEIDERGSKEVVTVFPSSTSPEGAWYVATRVRGSYILPNPIEASHLTYNTSDEDPKNHTFTYNVSTQYAPEQLAIWFSNIGDVFEDSASRAVIPG